VTGDRAYDAHRRAEKPWRKWYSLARWKRRRTAQLEAEPNCQRCKERGLTVPATVVHHVKKHNGNPKLFWYGRLLSDCKPCHDIIEQAIEVRGFEVGCDDNGRPIASDHPWNANKRA
jgi:hypothetical protein